MIQYPLKEVKKENEGFAPKFYFHFPFLESNAHSLFFHQITSKAERCLSIFRIV